MSATAITILVSITAINWFAVESAWTKSKVKNGYKVYSAPRGLKGLSFVGISAFIYGAIVNFCQNPNERWVSGILVVFAALAAYLFPATILLSQDKVIAVKWMGIRKIEMKWDDVDCVYSIPEESSIVIQDKNQNRIVHTIYNIDRAGLIEQVQTLPPQVLSKITIQI